MSCSVVASRLLWAGLVISLLLPRPVLAEGGDEGAAAAPPPVASVRVVPLREQMIGRSVAAYGRVVDDPARRLTIALPRAGRVSVIEVRAGQSVHRGDALLVFVRAAEVGQAWRQAVSAVHFAEGERDRMARLRSQQLATVSQLASAGHALADARDALEALRAQGADQSSVELRAPFNGRVLSVSVAPGDRVSANAALLQLSPQTGAAVVLNLDVDDLPGMQAGLPVRIVPLVGGSPVLVGHVVQVAGAVNPATQQVDVVVAAEAGRMMPGLRVRGEIGLPRRRALVVPRSAVLDDGHGYCLYQVRDGHAVRIAVQPGVTSGDLVAVRGAFLPDAPVVALGNYELQDGMAVRVGTP